MNLHPSAPTCGNNSVLRGFAAGSVLLAVALAGCGSDSDDSLTVQEFRDQSNEICAQSEQEIGEAVGAVFGGTEPTPEQLQDALDTIVTASRDTADGIDALAAPSSIRADVDAMVAELRSATDEAESQGLGFWENGGDPWVTANEMATDLGLGTCAES